MAKLNTFFGRLKEKLNQPVFGQPSEKKPKSPANKGFLHRHAISTGIIVVAIIAANVTLYILYPRDLGNQYIINTPTKEAVAAETEPVKEKPNISEFGLDISKINVWVPIIPSVDTGNEAGYLKALESGVALSKDSAESPEKLGNMFIFGHSEYYKNKPGDYKQVFQELNKMKKDDTFTVYYQKVAYAYEVTDSKVVAADDFSVLDATPEDRNDKTITIMTCWPPGTVQHRWIVFAKQI